MERASSEIQSPVWINNLKRRLLKAIEKEGRNGYKLSLAMGTKNKTGVRQAVSRQMYSQTMFCVK